MKENITINGNNYELDITQAEKLGVLKKKKVFENKSVGQIFKHGGGFYLLGRVNRNTINLFSLSDGNRWTIQLIVVDDCNINEEEWYKLLGSNVDTFEVVDKKTVLIDF